MLLLKKKVSKLNGSSPNVLRKTPVHTPVCGPGWLVSWWWVLGESGLVAEGALELPRARRCRGRSLGPVYGSSSPMVTPSWQSPTHAGDPVPL